MKTIAAIALIVCVLMPVGIVAQDKAKSNAFTFPGAQKQVAPPELKVDLTFNEPSGNGVLNAGETGRMNVTVTNTGGSPAKDVKIRVSTASRFDGVTFGKDFAVGDINPKEQKTVAVSFVAGRTLTDKKKRSSMWMQRKHQPGRPLLRQWKLRQVPASNRNHRPAIKRK